MQRYRPFLNSITMSSPNLLARTNNFWLFIVKSSSDSLQLHLHPSKTSFIFNARSLQSVSLFSRLSYHIQKWTHITILILILRHRAQYHLKQMPACNRPSKGNPHTINLIPSSLRPTSLHQINHHHSSRHFKCNNPHPSLHTPHQCNRCNSRLNFRRQNRRTKQERQDGMREVEVKAEGSLRRKYQIMN